MTLPPDSSTSFRGTPTHPRGSDTHVPTLNLIFVGTGRAAHAIASSLATLNLLSPEFNIPPPVWLPRGASLKPALEGLENAVLCIANPHGLHAEKILEADAAGYAAILCEKPACVTLEETHALRSVRTPTAILHVYRQTWGLQTLRHLIKSGELGDLITIEGRYWQSSTADRAIHLSEPGTRTSWKNDPRLSGPSDTFLDVGTHWVDAVSFLHDAAPTEIQGWRSYENAESEHRDSHVQLALTYPNGGRAFGSISKTVHGAMNHFEINVIGTRKSATWEFMKPDEILIGEGRDRRVITRKTSEHGSLQPPHHGMGWVEGYIEIARQLFNEVMLNQPAEYPRLQDNLTVLESMLKTRWN